MVGPGGSKRPPGERKRRRVLVIDDDDDVAEVLRDALSMDGFSVATVRHGAAALELLKHLPVDVILLDLRMPIMDGWSFVEQYRRDGARPQAAIVLLSGVPHLEDASRALGIDAYIEKPFELDALVETLKRATLRA